jgi:hypothetical protein
MKRIAAIGVALATLAGWSAVAMATPCVQSTNPPNPNIKVTLVDVESIGGSQYELTFVNWPIVTSSTNDCAVAVQFKTAVVASLDDVTWLETGTTNVVANLGTGWAANASVGTEAEGIEPSLVGEAWFGMLNTSGGTAAAGNADLVVTVTLQAGQTAGDLIDSLDKTGGRRFIITDQSDGAGMLQDVGRSRASLPPANLPGPKLQTDCKRTIAKEASKFVKAKTKTLQKCEEGKVKGKHNDTCPDPLGAEGAPGRKAADKIAKAISKLHAAIGKKCGGRDGVCGGDTFKEIGGGLAGRPDTCPDFESSGCTNAIDIFECTGIAACIECVGEAAVDQAIALYYADLEPTDPVAEAALNKCQQAIGKTVSKYLLAKEKALQKCWDKRYKNLHTAVCPDINGDPATEKDAVKAGEKIAKAESKKIAKICKACGGEDKLCDDTVTPINPGAPTFPGSGGMGLDADFTLDDILAGSGPFNCPSVTVPAGPSRPATLCGGTITTLADLIRCLDCVTEFKVDCVDPNRLHEEFLAYPSECN